MHEFDADTWARRTRENARITEQEPDVAALVERLEYSVAHASIRTPSLIREAAAALTELQARWHDNSLIADGAYDRANKAEAEVTRLREALKTADAGILPMAVRKKVRAALEPGELP